MVVYELNILLFYIHDDSFYNIDFDFFLNR